MHSQIAGGKECGGDNLTERNLCQVKGPSGVSLPPEMNVMQSSNVRVQCDDVSGQVKVRYGVAVAEVNAVMPVIIQFKYS